MRLKTVFVRFYKSFNFDYLRKFDPKETDSKKPWEMIGEKWYPYVEIPINSKVTAVVGANESGKSHLLTAIKKGIVGKDYEGKGIERQDFCRYSEFFSAKRGELKYPDFGFEWSLSEEDKDIKHKLKEILPNSKMQPKKFCLFRHKQDRYKVYVPSENGQYTDKFSSTELKEEEVTSLLNKLPQPFRIKSDITLPDSVPIIKILELANEDKPDLLKKLKDTTYGKKERKERAKIRKLLDSLAKEKQGSPTSKLPKNSSTTSSQSHKENTSSASSNSGSQNYIDLQGELKKDENNTEENRKYQIRLVYDLICKVAKVDEEALLELAESMIEENEGFTRGIIEQINTALEESLNFPTWWVQDREFRLIVSAKDHDLGLTIRDRTGTEYSFKERSQGLTYFLSYYIQYKAHDKADEKILLMDEPDAFLSSQAQQTLLKMFEAFANGENNNDEDRRDPVQVVYVTHSPFLIDKNHEDRIRVLEKGEGEEGTRVVKDADKNHYEPLRSAFGAFVGEETFIGNCNLMVESLATKIILAGAATYLRSTDIFDDQTLDLNHLTIIPTEGACHIPYLVYLAREQGIEKPALIVLLNSNEEGEKAKSNLTITRARGQKEEKLLDEKFILQIGDLLKFNSDSQSKIDFPEGIKLSEIEDLIPLPICIKAAKTYAEEFCVASKGAFELITEDDIKGKLSEGKTIFSAINECFKECLKEIGEEELQIERIGFARYVLKTVKRISNEPNDDRDVIEEFKKRFKFLFELLNERERKATEGLNADSISQKIVRRIDSFIQDYPNSPKRGIAKRLFKSMEDVLDSSRESDHFRSAIQEIRNEYNIETEPNQIINEYEKFKEAGLNYIKNAPLISIQAKQPEDKSDEDYTQDLDEDNEDDEQESDESSEDNFDDEDESNFDNNDDNQLDQDEEQDDEQPLKRSSSQKRRR
jgi:predicted ATP-dependent endonuclease of OLD family